MISRWALLDAIALVSAALAGAVLSCEDAREDEQKVIRQGGYVERVDPNANYKDRLPRIPPREPHQSLQGFRVAPGFRLELVASEPLVNDPVDLAFDESGRLFVVEMVTYSEAGDTRQGRVSLLEDVDGDGVFDRGSAYLDGLAWPTGVACFDGGIFVASAPDLLYAKDTDGDGRADVTEVVLTGFDTSNPNALPNSLRWGLDSRLHGMTSTSGGLLRAVKWETAGGEGESRPARPIQSRGRDFSLDPRTGELRLETGGAQFGMTWDAWGRKFESSNSAPIEMVMYEEQYAARNPSLVLPSPRVSIRVGPDRVFRTSPVEPWRVIRTEMRLKGAFSGPVEGGGTPAGYFTSACGVMIYTGNAWPSEYQGNAFVCEGAGNLVHRMRLEPNGVGFTAHRVEQNKEFLTSEEVWFRPVQFTNAPDGTLYLADMYREIFEHPDAVPPSVKQYIDLNAGNDRGRVYRIVPDGFRQPPPVRLAALSTADLVRLLAHPNGWHRTTASRLIFERQDAGAVTPLEDLAADSSSPTGRVRAMWALVGLGRLSTSIVVARLRDAHPRVREHAVRLSDSSLAEAPELREQLYSMVHDEDPRVRYQLAFTLGNDSASRATEALAALVEKDGEDSWVRLAVSTSVSGRGGDLLALLSERSAWLASKPARVFMEDLAELVGREARSDQVAIVLKAIEAWEPSLREMSQGVVRGLSRGLEKSRSPLVSSLGDRNVQSVLRDLVRKARDVASDAARPLDERVEAIRSLSLEPVTETWELLLTLLEGSNAPEVQIAALQTLGRFARDGVAEAILEGWNGYSPRVRSEATEVLFSRPEWLSVFLTAIEEEGVERSQIEPSRVAILRKHPRREIAERAEALFSDTSMGRRQDVFESYRHVLKRAGDVDRGRDVFRKECSICHRLEGEGFDLGLPLQSVKNRGRETILLSILDPNREVNPQYIDYVVISKQGLLTTGIITSETATSVTLERGEGVRDTILRRDVEVIESTGLSIMPEGLEEQIDEDSMADLLEYLMTVE